MRRKFFLLEYNAFDYILVFPHAARRYEYYSKAELPSSIESSRQLNNAACVSPFPSNCLPNHITRVLLILIAK